MLYRAALRRWWPVVLFIIAIYVSLALGRALTMQPWNDEAWYASPSWSLIHFGTTGTPLLETAGQFWKGINQRTYWVVPLQFFVQVPWFEVFGFSLLSARLHAMAWGLIGLAAWGFTVARVTRDVGMALMAMLLIACDYQFVSQTALGRMDAMSLALAALGICLYLHLRERNLTVAILVSQTAVAACGLTHPTPGVPAFAAVLFLILYYDRDRVEWRHLFVAVIPYIVGAAGWAWYISAAPDLFRAQFLGNVTDIDRLGGFRHPLTALAREFGRYAGMAGFEPGMHPLYRIKLAVILVYATAVIGLLVNRDTRRDPRIRPLLWLWFVYFVAMTIYDNTKEVKYAIHLVPVYDAVTAVWIVWLWRRGRAMQMAAAACAAVFLVTSIGGLLYTTFIKDDYHKSYLPMAEFLQRTAAPNDMILASSELGFALGFDRNIVDDSGFTYFSGKSPEFIVIGDGYRPFIEHDRRTRPKVYHHLRNMLEQNYTLVYSHAGYDIYERRDHPKLTPVTR